MPTHNAGAVGSNPTRIATRTSLGRKVMGRHLRKAYFPRKKMKLSLSAKLYYTATAVKKFCVDLSCDRPNFVPLI